MSLDETIFFYVYVKSQPTNRPLLRESVENSDLRVKIFSSYKIYYRKLGPSLNDNEKTDLMWNNIRNKQQRGQYVEGHIYEIKKYTERFLQENDLYSFFE